MNPDQPPQNLESLLQRLEQAGEADHPVTIECMLQATDERSFGATMPPLELIPFGNSTAGAALSVLGLGMMARDGAMILAALLFFFGLAYMVSRLWF